MVKRILKLFHREFGGLHKAAAILAASSLVSGLLGLLRDRLLAGTFGAGQQLDIYYASFKIPDFLYTLSLFLASVTVLIPFFLEKVKVSQEKGNEFFNNIFSAFLYIIIILVVLVFFSVPFFVKLVAPGFSLEARNQLIILTRILLFSPLLLGLSNILSSVVQSFRRFFVYALSPILYNIGIIFGILFFYPRFGMKGIAFGVVLGALMHVSIQIPSIIRLGFMPKIKIRLNWKEAWGVIKLSLPRTFGLGLNQIVFIFITATASFLAAGSISIFNLSFNLYSVLLTVTGVSYSVAAFPTLAKLFVSNQRKDFLDHTIVAMRQILFWSIPVSVLFLILRAQIVRVLFGYGQFGWRDTRLTAASLALFVISLSAHAVVILFIRAFYAAGRTVKPIIINVISYSFIIAGIFFFMKLINTSEYVKYFLETTLRVEDVPGVKVLILPLFYSIGMILNSFFQCKFFQREFGEIWSSVSKTFFQAISASFLMGTVTYFSLNILDKVFDINTFIGIFLQGFISGIVGIVVWYFALHHAKNEELREVTTSIKQRFWKSPDAITPEPEELP